MKLSDRQKKVVLAIRQDPAKEWSLEDLRELFFPKRWQSLKKWQSAVRQEMRTIARCTKDEAEPVGRLSPMGRGHVAVYGVKIGERSDA